MNGWRLWIQMIGLIDPMFCEIPWRAAIRENADLIVF